MLEMECEQTPKLAQCPYWNMLKMELYHVAFELASHFLADDDVLVPWKDKAHKQHLQQLGSKVNSSFI
jgi:hypothetical protein